MTDETVTRLFYCLVSLVMVIGLGACCWGFISLIERTKLRDEAKIPDELTDAARSPLGRDVVPAASAASSQLRDPG